MATDKKFNSLKEFYPFYLSEHQNTTSRRLHFTGTGIAVGILFYCLFSLQFGYLWWALICGYLFAWVGHFFFEKNKPATFQYPFYSLASDFILFWEILTGKEKL